ncbi:cation diffusion facilitator family transporter [Candidatus Saccharibacteria bacterium]|nr:cation diffusion facilitator family transporter [Candidatus Saccharibacteria bacterium]
MKTKSRQKIATRAALVTITGDILLAALKLFAGIFGHSSAMIADAVHTLADMLTTVIVIIGVKLGARRADKNHPYGHERLESVAAILLSVTLATTGIGIGWHGVGNIIAFEHGETLVVPGLIALVAAAVTIALKGIMYLYKRAVARRIDSGALQADSVHHLTDSLSSVGSFLAILGSRLGFPILDSIAAIGICLFIIKTAFDIFRSAINKMTDHAADEATEDAIRHLILEQANILGIDRFRTRLFGNRIYVEVAILVNGDKSLREAHKITKQVQLVIQSKFPKVKHCFVSVNPA